MTTDRRPAAVPTQRTQPGRREPGLFAPGDVTVHLQPQMSLADGRTVGVEAFVHRVRPGRGTPASGAPASGAPAFEVPVSVAPPAGRPHGSSGTGLDLALAAASRWWSHRAPLPVTLGLAAADVRDPHLPQAVTAALARHGLPARALTLQVAEELLAHEAAAARLGGLRAVGVAVCVDHYGSGRSPLTALREVPADELKLDPALVTDVVTDARAAAIARHTVALAHELGLRVVADGVHDVATVGALAAMGCDAAQGLEIAPAMPVDVFVGWLSGRPADRRLPADPARRADLRQARRSSMAAKLAS